MIKREILIRGQVYRLTTWGQPQAHAWLFLHGFMGSSADFAPFATKLSGYRISLDLLGFGPQAATVPATRLAMTPQIQDLAALLAELGVTQVNLVGYSMGGRLALGFTLAQPQLVGHLFLESSTAGLADDLQRRQRQQHDQQLAQTILHNGLTAFVDYWTQLPLFASQRRLPAAQQQRMRRQRLQQNPQNLASSLLQMGTGSQPNFWPCLAQVGVAVTLIVGAQDQKFSQLGQQLQARLSRSSLVTIASAGHNTHFEAPDQFLTALIGG
ncbi:2-succinyl-6-hydroxy-2,4-cyclohexadiene-1-carboxylate synthase [Loigolactobacillus zhaoyuanensis]|uniref:Putative 2-succinyl-6-hydroxy-2,4-cyclohexadiene-1-carboxylate synthase n=1 Tax=Loigolactobacillus zhaoyuanensis TaxID=2486017 RepID=A0ABW8UJN7_9LACO|nr:2-succinyl-6-hydroxy-2,4-cyclohexadiene-1-carboxylate synthase [Loigolactobacillus zhaoyuanensis]